MRGRWAVYRGTGIGRFDMDWYYAVAWTAIFTQLLFLYYAVRNYLYALSKHRRGRRPQPMSRVALLIPCKGLDARFRTNITSFLTQNCDGYRLFFVVQDEGDPAYAALREIKETLGPKSRASDIQILVAGLSASCSQKTHNLLYAFNRLPEETKIVAFADSDICVHEDWLMRLVWPLRRPGRCMASGYRWFVPTSNNLPTLILSALNGSIAQLLGNSRFNHAWGGSMAIRMEDARRIDLTQVWNNTVSDDFSLSQAVKRAGMKVTFVPACLVPSFECITWAGLCEFTRRQLLITRVYAPRTWWAGFLASCGSVVGQWGSLAAALYAAATGAGHLFLYASVPAIFLAGQVLRAVLRQATAMKILPECRRQLRPAAAADILGCWLWSPLLLLFLLSSAFGRTISWRGIRYRLLGPTRTEVLSG
jgi:ceramide glucosyltransferase